MAGNGGQGARAGQPRGGGGHGGRGGGGNPLLNPGVALSGHALMQAAKALVNSQINGPYSELAHQIAVNNRQGAGAQQRTAGYFNQLGRFGKQSVADEGQIASGLNSQLANIGSGVQSTLGQIGQSAQGALSQYSPGVTGGTPGSQALTAELARQQGLAAQTSGASRTFGAEQGANYQGLAAANLGTFAQTGQEDLGKIAQATRLSNEPLSAKMASLQEQRGSLLAKDIGALRQQEITNRMTQEGLGLKQTALKIQQQNDLANQKLAGQRIQVMLNGQQITLSYDKARIRLATIDQQLASQRLSETQRHDLATEKVALQRALNTAKSSSGSSGGVGGARPLTTHENNTSLASLNKIQSIIQMWQQGGFTDKKTGKVLVAKPSNAQMVQKLGQEGYDPNLVQAAFELLGWGYITPVTARALHQAGIRGGTFRGKPIVVKARPPGAFGLGNLSGGF